MLCNAWELSQSHEMVTMPFATFSPDELQKRIAELEYKASDNASSIHAIISVLDVNDETHGFSDNMYDTALGLAHKLRDRVAELEAQHRWISVKDRLPERQGTTYLNARYLVLYHGYYHDINVFSPSNKKWLCGEVDKTEHVTHWMDIPDLPEEVQK